MSVFTTKCEDRLLSDHLQSISLLKKEKKAVYTNGYLIIMLSSYVNAVTPRLTCHFDPYKTSIGHALIKLVSI